MGKHTGNAQAVERDRTTGKPGAGRPAAPGRSAGKPEKAARSGLRNHTLSIVATVLFLLTLAGQSIAGHREYNQEQKEHGEPGVSYTQYLTSPHFGEATFENWESEFLQMAMFIFLTAFLVQKGSAESRKPEGEEGAGEEEIDEDPRKHRRDPDAPWPVHRGGLALKLYENSLSLVLFLLFVVSFLGHAATGAAEYSEDQTAHGGEPVPMLRYMATSRFWFESFQNWQSEFLAVLAVVVLSVFLRQRGSPESKPVHKPHAETGNS
ncbi:MAG TPA: DUF6766 family protein [Longimicrobiaceae bacterium]|nr:DUF6766 family protein [Longimicrobiaceae bacterium]